MSIKFTIKNFAQKATKDADGAYIRYTGTGEPFRRVSERQSETRGVDNAGKPVFNFVTGLDENKVEFYKWYNEEEKKAVKKQIKDLKPLILNFYGGEKVLQEDNQYFWLRDRHVSRLSLSHENIDTFYDTKNPVHALLYLSIIAGAFEDLVAPTREYAERFQRQHYLALETDDIIDDEDEVTKADAFGSLADLRKDESPEALFILAWCILYETNSFGGFLRSTPQRELINSHVKYIDGKLVTKKKRNTPQVFIDYAEKWKGQQTRPSLYIEAYLKAGEYYSLINQKEKKFTTMDGTVLGNTIDEAVAILQKPKFQQDLEKLREQVEAKWKE